MPKMKTKSAVKKRFKLTATGKVKAGHAYKRHCLGCKSQKMKRNARGTAVLQKGDANLVKHFMPYGG
ncbi:MAG: 50S ribosomal protein L35 [Alphaproteobacteria bacterium]|nr:50S ribosomal protein L35 [Alphaproteobacteria bacterium]